MQPHPIQLPHPCWPFTFTSPLIPRPAVWCGCSVWFAAVEVAFILAGRNFMMEYMKDWNPREVGAASEGTESATASGRDCWFV